MHKAFLIFLSAGLIINLSGCTNAPEPKQLKNDNAVSIQTQAISTQIVSETQHEFPFNLPSGWQISKEELRPDSYEAYYSNGEDSNYLNFFILGNKDEASLEKAASDSFNTAMKNYETDSGREKPLKMTKSINNIPVTIVEYDGFNEGKPKETDYFFQKGNKNYKVIINDYAKNNESIIEYIITSISAL